jgi:uncharacterized protein
MSTKMFVNLPVEDLGRSRAFYESLGYSCSEQFTDEKAACVVISDQIFAMLQTRPFFSTLTNKEIVDSHTSAEVLLALGVESRERVDELADRALTAGGSPAGEPMDLGFMYRRSFQDPDGHQLEALYLDLSAAPPQPNAASHP